jgi:hypothetical protein
VLGGVLLYAKSRGWTAAWEREHRALLGIAFVVVAWAAAGSLVFLVVLGAVVAGPVVPVVLWRALEAVALSAVGFATGRLASLIATRRALDGRPRLRSFAAATAVLVVLQWSLSGAAGLPWAVSLGGVYLLAVAFGIRSQRGPSPAAGN